MGAHAYEGKTEVLVLVDSSATRPTTVQMSCHFASMVGQLDRNGIKRSFRRALNHLDHFQLVVTYWHGYF
ncbi:hypothetical protein EJB05_44575, partial [Eragrostis curvula]